MFDAMPLAGEHFPARLVASWSHIGIRAWPAGVLALGRSNGSTILHVLSGVQQETGGLNRSSVDVVENA
jgi:hypothetical protein